MREPDLKQVYYGLVFLAIGLVAYFGYCTGHTFEYNTFLVP